MNLEFAIRPRTIDLSEISASIRLLSDKVGLDYNELVKQTFKGRNVYDIPVIKGKATTTGLYKSLDVAVAETVFDADTRFVNHVHEEFEMIGVVSGEMHLTVGDEVKILLANDAIMVPPFVVHDSFTPIHTVAIIITVPACPSWPEGTH
jgi:mannose-6-phosphate isomerase-like protein (cupin superfamily)